MPPYQDPLDDLVPYNPSSKSYNPLDEIQPYDPPVKAAPPPPPAPAGYPQQGLPSSSYERNWLGVPAINNPFRHDFWDAAKKLPGEMYDQAIGIPAKAIANTKMYSGVSLHDIWDKTKLNEAIPEAASSISNMFIRPYDVAHQQAEHLTRQVLAASGNYDPEMGPGLNAPSYAVSPLAKIGLIASGQGGVDPEKVVPDIQKGDYSALVGDVGVPLAMNYALAKIGHASAGPRETFQPGLPPKVPEQMNLFERGNYGGGTPRPTPFVPESTGAGVEHLPGPTFPDMGGTQPNLPGVKALGGTYGQSAFKFPEGPVTSADFDPQPWRNWKPSETPTFDKGETPAETPSETPTPTPTATPAPSIQADIPGVDTTMGPDGVTSVEIRGNAAKPENLVKLRAAGFVPVEGGRSPGGYAVWQLDPNAPKATPTTPAAPYVAPTKARARAGAKPAGGFKIQKDGSVEIPSGGGQELYDNLSKQGYNFDKTLPNGNSRFVKGQPKLPSDAGSVDMSIFGDIVDFIKGDKDKLTPEQNKRLWDIFNANRPPENVEPPPTGSQKLRIDQNIDAAQREPVPQDKELGELERQAGEVQPKTQQEIDNNHRALTYFVDKYGADWLGEFQRAEKQGTVEMEVKHNYVRPGVHGAAVAAREKPQGLLSKFFSDERGQVGLDINAGGNPNLRWGYNKETIDKFRTGLPKAESWNATRFILPSGERLTHNFPIHEQAAESVGSSLTEALQSGVMRVGAGFWGAEVNRPITEAAAKSLIQGASNVGRNSVGLDVIGDDYYRSGYRRSKNFQIGEVEPKDIVKWVDSVVQRPGSAAPAAPRPFRFGLGDDRGAVGADINAGEQPNIPVKPGDPTGPVNNAKLKDGTTWDKVRSRLGWGKGGTIRSTAEKAAEHNFVDESWAIAKNLDTIGDYSGIKQTFPLWYTKQFREGIIPMIKAGWDKDLSLAIEDQLKDLPIMEHYLDANGNELPSIADKIGFKLRDTVDNRAELVSSKWVENGKFFGLPDNPASKFYSQTLGRVARGSNRAFTTIRNHVGANRLQFLMDAARDMSISAEEKGYARPGFFHMKQAFTPEEAVDLNPYNNLVLGRDISDYVRTVIGDAPLKTHVLPFRGGEWNIESSTKHLGRFFFAPRNIAKQVRMMNPSTYIMATPMVRKQYMTSMLATMGAAVAITEMSKLAADAAGIPATISWDMDNADFAKLKIGDTRFDFGQGFLPYFVLAHRMLWSGGYRSSTTKEFHKFGHGIGIETATGTGMNFVSNKLDPLMKFAWDLGNASDFRQFNVGDRTSQLFMAMAPLDLYNIAKAKPYLLPASIIPVLAGAGTQTYGRGTHTGVDVESRIIPPRFDAIFKGGGPSDFLREIGKAGQRDIKSMGF